MKRHSKRYIGHIKIETRIGRIPSSRHAAGLDTLGAGI